jgi:alanyl-tRNA synthetase
VIEARFDNVNSEALKKVFDALKKQSPNMVAVLCSTTEDNKLNIVLGVSGVIADHPKMSAKDLLNEKVGPLFNIKGGGRKDLAQGGGAGMKVTDEQLKKTREVIEKFILSLGL